MKKLLLALLFALCLTTTAGAQTLNKFVVRCEASGGTATTAGTTSSTKHPVSYASSAVRIYQAGTTTDVSLYTDSAGLTPLSNPTTCTSTATLTFYASPAYVDVRLAPSGVTPFITTWATLNVVGTNSALLPSQAENDALDGTYGTPSSSNKYVTDTDPRVNHYYNVKKYGATGDGSTNDTISIQAAIMAAATAGGGTVFFPGASTCYKVTTGTVTVSTNNVRLLGVGRASRICAANGTGHTITLDSGLTGAALNTYLYGTGVENLYFEPLVARTSGYEIYAPHFDVIYLQKLYFYNVYGGMLLGRSTDLSVIAHVSDIRMDVYYIGLKLTNVLDGWFSGLSFNTGKMTAGATGVWLSGGCESNGFDKVDVVNAHADRNDPAFVGTATYALRIYNDAGTATPARFNKFSRCFWDTHNPSAYIQDGADNRFDNNFFSSSLGGGLVLTGTSTNNSFNNSDAVNCYTDGVYVDSTGGGHIFSAFHSIANGRSGLGNGFSIAGTASYVTITASKAVRDTVNFPGNAQPYGLSVAVGVTHLKVADSDLSANGTAAYNILSTSRTIVLDDNTTEYGVGDAVRVYRITSAQAIADSTTVPIQFNAERDDPNTMHDTVTNNTQLFVRTSGFYGGGATVQYETNGTGYRQVAIYVCNAGGSGCTYIAAQRVPAVTGAPTIVNVAVPPLFLFAGQYVEVHGYQNSGVSLNAELAPAMAPEASFVKQ